MRIFAVLFVSSTAALTPATSHGKRSATNMALRVERSVGEGLRRLYRLPKLTTAPSKARRSADDFFDDRRRNSIDRDVRATVTLRRIGNF